jgi:TMEM175 potassium channel family protein
VANHQSMGHAARPGDPARLIALADGVFAIVMTLLVLDLRVPLDVSEAELQSHLIHHLPSLLAYVFAFLLTAEYWMGHRATFNNIRGTNLPIVLLNVGFLLLVALVPFGASLIGSYPQSRTALFVYGVLWLMLEAYRAGMWLYICTRGHELATPMPGILFRRRLQVMIVEILVVAIVVALLPWLPPIVAFFTLGIVPVAFFFAMGFFGRRHTGRA